MYADGSDRWSYPSRRSAVIVLLTGIGLNASDFLLTGIDKPAPNSFAGGWYAPARVFGIQLPSGQTSSGTIATRTFTVVPEPCSMTLLALGLGGVGIAALRRRGR